MIQLSCPDDFKMKKINLSIGAWLKFIGTRGVNQLAVDGVDLLGECDGHETNKESWRIKCTLVGASRFPIDVYVQIM